MRKRGNVRESACARHAFMTRAPILARNINHTCSDGLTTAIIRKPDRVRPDLLDNATKPRRIGLGHWPWWPSRPRPIRTTFTLSFYM